MEKEKLKNSGGIEERGAEIAVEREGDRPKGKHLFQPGQSGNPAGKPKGVQNKIPKTIREAILAATQPGACHEDGLKGWLIERANGGIEDRKIFGAMVSRALPIEVTGTDGGPIKIDLGWLSERRIGYGDVIDVIPTVDPQQSPDANEIKGLPVADADTQSGDGGEA